MKRIVSIAGILAGAALIQTTSYAWHVEGHVLCAGGAPGVGVTINVTGSSCQGSFSGSIDTDSNGYYFLFLPDCAGSYTACLDTTTLPPGASLTSPDCVSFSLTDTTQSTMADYELNCSGTGPCPPVSSCITSGFNGTPIGPNYWIWFNSVIKVSGRNSNPATINFAASTVTFGGTTVTLPPAIITFDATATEATTTFDTGSGTWETTVPATYSGNVFLSGVAVPVPGGLPGGVSPVTWCGDFSAGSSGLGFQWQWAAAVYQCFSSDMTQVGVKPVDANNLSIYQNSDHAGTPETFKVCVKGGARGGGGSNWTGSYSATKGSGWTVF